MKQSTLDTVRSCLVLIMSVSI